MRVVVVPTGHKEDGNDAAQCDADNDIHTADLRLVQGDWSKETGPRRLNWHYFSVPSLWGKISLEVMKEAQGQRSHRSVDLGMLASALLSTRSATVKIKASLTP